MTISQVIRNTINFRKRFAKLPRKAIDLDIFLDPCGTVGCLAGWGTIWYGSGENLFIHLGMDDFETATGNRLFVDKRKRTLTHRAEALQRLDRRIMELKALRRRG